MLEALELGRQCGQGPAPVLPTLVYLKEVLQLSLPLQGSKAVLEGLEL